MLCFAMVLVVAVAHRNVLVEEQRSANELRAAIAFEAAEAGLEWALARINDPARTGSECLPSADATARSFRDRMLSIGIPTGTIVPATWSDAGTPTPLQAACVRTAAGWLCSCPGDRRPELPAPGSAELAPAFVVELATAARPDVVRVIARGCTWTGVGRACEAANPAGHEAVSRLEVAWARVPALRSPPAAALSVRGDGDGGAAALGVHHGDANSGALAIHAGGRIAASALRVTAADGASLGGSLVSRDVLLRDLADDRFFARHFGMGVAAWTTQPAASHVACAGDCATALAAAVAAGARLLVVAGDAAIDGPATLGGVDDPVALVVTGALRVSGDLALHGLLHAASLQWDDAVAGAAFVRGAVLVGGDYRGNAAPDLRHDPAPLARLAAAHGSFVRINGSWKDF
jgi:hypothetical protein